MTVLLYTLVTLLCLKVAWNVLIPFALAARPGRGVSMAVFVELILLLLAVAASAASDGESWIHSPKHVGLAGLAAIVLSYAGAAALGGILFLLERRKRERR